MGAALLKEVTEATGLPHEPIADELNRLITTAGLNSDSITLEDLRSVLAEYLQDVMLEVQKEMEGSSSK